MNLERKKRPRLNKVIAGYHILMILAAVDYKFHAQEDLVIRDYIAKEFPFRVNLDQQVVEISSLQPEEWETHFLECIEDFSDTSTHAERMDLIKFAMELCKADKIVTKEENQYINMLLDAWYNES